MINFFKDDEGRIITYQMFGDADRLACEDNMKDSGPVCSKGG